MAASGTATLDFGTTGNPVHAQVDVASAGVVAGSLLEAWVRVVATADHSADEARIEPIKVTCEYLSINNFRIYGECTEGSTWGRFTVNWVWA